MNETLVIALDESQVPVKIRRSATARRMTLRLDAQKDGLVLVLPKRTSVAEGQRFILAHLDWVRSRFAALPPRHPFEAGASVPLLGVDHSLIHRPDMRRGVWTEEGAIHVSGDAEFLSRRVTDFLKEEARRQIFPLARAKASRIDARIGRVTVKDTRSRWGSCSSAGDLAFSWRLVMAPDWVLDYVIAHEVAHLREMNHSDAFWRLVAQLTNHRMKAQAWLKANGTRLHRFGGQ